MSERNLDISSSSGSTIIFTGLVNITMTDCTFENLQTETGVIYIQQSYSDTSDDRYYLFISSFLTLAEFTTS